jgi:hypothetical protein
MQPARRGAILTSIFSVVGQQLPFRSTLEGNAKDLGIVTKPKIELDGGGGMGCNEPCYGIMPLVASRGSVGMSVERQECVLLLSL